MSSGANPDVDSFYSIVEVEDGPAVAGDLFWRRYRERIPDFPVHVVGMWTDADGRPQPVCYVHLTRHGDAFLVGGACVDNRRMRRMPQAQRTVFAQSGGVYYHTLTRIFRDYGDRCAAFFGHCGDPLAKRIHVQAGAQSAREPYLMVYYPRPMEPAAAQALIDEVNALGPF